jgi:SAM-dependent methyltransferase
MATPTIQDVRRFWTDHPLFAGEGRHEVGSREWFLEHERVYLDDVFVGEVPAIFSRDVREGAAILDAGCGPGIWVRYFLRRGAARVRACDLTVTAVNLTRASLTMFGLAARLDVANIEQLPYRSGVFDHVNCQGVVHHTPNPQAAIDEFRRVLRDGGTLCFSVYHRNALLRRASLLRLLRPLMAPFVSLKGRGRETLLASADPDEIVRRYDGGDNPLGRSYTVDELRQMLKGRFEIEEIAYFYFPSRVLPLRLPTFIRAWLSAHAGLMVVLRCRAAGPTR